MGGGAARRYSHAQAQTTFIPVTPIFNCYCAVDEDEDLLSVWQRIVYTHINRPETKVEISKRIGTLSASAGLHIKYNTHYAISYYYNILYFIHRVILLYDFILDTHIIINNRYA